jgi:hypothetical protein
MISLNILIDYLDIMIMSLMKFLQDTLTSIAIFINDRELNPARQVTRPYLDTSLEIMSVILGSAYTRQHEVRLS